MLEIRTPERVASSRKVDRSDAVRRVDHDRGARFRIRDGVVVGEVLEPGGHRDHRQAVRVERVDLAGHLEAADVGVRGDGERGRRAGRLDDAHVEARVVGDQDVAARELDEVGKLLAPERGVHDIRCLDSVDADVPVDEVVVTDRRMDQPPDPIDDLPVAHLDEADRAGTGAGPVRGLEVDRGEIQGHAPMLSCTL